MRYFIFGLLTSVCLGCNAVTQPVQNSASHHTPHGFTNPHIEDPDKSFFSFMGMRFFGDEEWADHAKFADQVPFKQANIDLIQTPPDTFQITWLGHSTFLIQHKGINILTDPVFTDRASPYSFAGPERYVPHALDYALLPKIDLVIISHNHYDHLDEESITTLANQAHFYVPLGIGEILKELNVPPAQITEMDWWDSIAVSEVTIQALPSQHWSARGLFDRFETLWASWSIKVADTHIWFAGDTGYNDIQFKQIGERVAPIDVALIPIGAYAPRWFMKTYHVNPEEAIKIHQDVGAKMSIGMHWGTFPLTAEPPMEPVEKLVKAREDARIKTTAFITMAIGETKQFEDEQIDSK